MNEGDTVKWNCPVSGRSQGTVVSSNEEFTIAAVEDPNNLSLGKPLVKIPTDKIVDETVSEESAPVSDPPAA